MASKAAIAKHKKNIERIAKGSTKVKQSSIRNRCELCGRPRGYVGRFKLCRICLRQRALNGELPGVRKVSW